ncbi:uncharacterized protein STEHIDRAFT_136162 [Stereum hirsutum FP-91666 SS1]|uniref:uncharacterized protein n=1 Tax=Stereum hirsutum (strain FP-91666) TaxID=721885 RepID=UPI00044101D2|nr:uncharacterized protein STEHIDRAFT_136162 [Stereum hirsutum FP-91666 SS1]EIM92163.1 hypothetical protein STEHIDRAFT_136162 [Stereum hirsutum FP-91666 SS1]
MESDSSSSSIRSPDHPLVESDAKSPDMGELEYGSTSPEPRNAWYTRVRNRAADKYPGTYGRALQWYRWTLGPRPKVDLPDPVPLLDRDVELKNKTITLRVESQFMRISRRLTSPWLFLFLAVAYIIGLSFFSRANSFMTPSDSWIGCTSTFWLANDGCGLDGASCAPFDDSTVDFRCPAQCASVVLQNPRTVGNEQTEWVPLIVGGGDDNWTYRGDTFICAAALQAGLYDDSVGGCGTVSLLGNFTDFLPRVANGLTSIRFPTIFPLSYRVTPSSALTQCSDLRNDALALNVIVTAIIFMVLRPRPIILFWCLVCIGFWHVTLFSQPRTNPPDLADAFGTFLPTLFICYAFWRMAIRHVLPVFSKTMPIEGGIWFLGPYWVTILTNLTTDKIPIDRLTAADIKAQPGGLTALIIIIIVLIFIVVNQIRVIRKTGWLPHYLRWYIFGGLTVLVLAFLPTLNLRIHHYVLAMALIPGTAFPTRLSAIYQGFLLGMFLNGAAAWGFDSILQTAAQLQRDAASGSALPSFLTNSTTYNASVPLQNQTIFWDALPSGDDWDGFELLVDDVERYVGTALNFSLSSLADGIPHFFRLALTNGGSAGDFTMAATLWPNGTWVDPLSGPS